LNNRYFLSWTVYDFTFENTLILAACADQATLSSNFYEFEALYIAAMQIVLLKSKILDWTRTFKELILPKVICPNSHQVTEQLH
jgi:hypothetical protein